jgi:hypothetical protein
MMTLLNVSSASPSSILKRAGMSLTRLDNLAHVLSWSSDNVRDAGDALFVDLIELPHMNLSFKAKQVLILMKRSQRSLYFNYN